MKKPRKELPAFIEFWVTYLLYMGTIFAIIVMVDLGLHTEWILGTHQGTINTPGDTTSEKSSVLDKLTGEDTKKGLSQELIQKLQNGGYTLYIRHTSRTNPSNTQTFDRLALTKEKIPLDTHGNGVCVTDVGKAEAQLLGGVLRLLKIPIGTIYSSPVCRAVETAQFAFGRVDKFSGGFVLDGALAGDKEKEARTEIGKALMLQMPQAGKNKVITAHVGIPKLLGFNDNSISLPVGGMYIIEHKDEDDAEIIATITLADLAKALEVDLSTRPAH